MESKRKYEEDIKTRMEEWDEQIRELKIQAEKVDPQWKSRYQKKLHEIEHEIETEKLVMNQRLQELEESSGDTWRDISSILEKAAVDLKETLERAAKYFGKGA
jgi:hypothetical protein